MSHESYKSWWVMSLMSHSESHLVRHGHPNASGRWMTRTDIASTRPVGFASGKNYILPLDAMSCENRRASFWYAYSKCRRNGWLLRTLGGTTVLCGHHDGSSQPWCIHTDPGRKTGTPFNTHGFNFQVYLCFTSSSARQKSHFYLHAKPYTQV